MNFSLILPSRGRVQMLSTLCRSIDKNTIDHDNIEMLIGYDFDDTDTVKYLGQVKYSWIKPHGRNRGNSISRDYQNWMYPKSIGKYIFLLNDDVEMKTYGWDKIAIEKLNNKDIVYGWTNDCETTNRF